MNKTIFLPLAMLLLALLAGVAAPAEVQSGRGLAPHDPLFQTIAALDGKVFDAYNSCDLETFGSLFTEELEFYHDNGGLVAQTRQSLVEAVKNNICGKVRRELVPETLEVYPMHGYGALQMGIHRFHHPGREAADGVGEAKFVHLWQNTDGVWRITRVISYDHHTLAE